MLEMFMQLRELTSDVLVRP